MYTPAALGVWMLISGRPLAVLGTVGWTTSLSARQFDAKVIIALCADHGTHEQFHSEFKTDLDLERLPSGKFDTNYLVCGLAALAMNILRLMGQAGLLGKTLTQVKSMRQLSGGNPHG